jgi:hypothetical protein
MTRSILVVIALIAASIGFVRPADAQTPARSLRLAFETDGTVTLEAAGVTTREVLLEWARQCGCLVVNAQNVTGTLDVPVLFSHAPQEAVLASLLRKAAGFALTPRRAGMTGPSRFETIYVLPTSSPSSAAAGFAPPAPAFTPVPPPTAGSPADEIPPVTPIPTLPERGAPPAAAQPPAQTPPAPRLPGTPTRFVPIVPIGSGPEIPPGVQPGAPTQPATIPGTPTPAQPPAGAPSSPVVAPR